MVLLQRAFRNETGTSLVEILVAMVLTAIVFGGLLQSSLLVANKNVENLLRDEAVSVAEEGMDAARNMSFTTLVTGASVTITRDFRGVAGFPFNTQRTVTPLGADNKQVDITVTWNRKGKNYRHNISTVVRNK
jgi:type II secretory pathway pseudopilin PulG